MRSNVDKIVANFTKTVNKLRCEALLLDTVSESLQEKGNEMLQKSKEYARECQRAEQIANRLEELIV